MSPLHLAKWAGVGGWHGARSPNYTFDRPASFRDHTLRSALKSSVLWYYRALAQRAGLPAVTRLVRHDRTTK